MGPSPLALGIAGTHILRYRNFDDQGVKVDDDIWTNTIGAADGGAQKLSTLGCPPELYESDPTVLGYAFTDDDVPQIKLWAANDGGDTWSTTVGLIWASAGGNWAGNSLRIDVNAYGVGNPAGIPFSPNAVDATTSPAFRVDYIRTSAGLIPEPATMALLVLGAGCALRRKQRHN